MNTMYFREPPLAGMPNVTIRRGEKWKRLNPGETIELLEVGTSNSFGSGVVKEVFYCPYNKLPDYVFWHNREDVRSMYDGFNVNEYVTVVIFEAK